MLPLSEHSPHITVYVILLYMPKSPNLYANMYSDKEYYYYTSYSRGIQEKHSEK